MTLSSKIQFGIIGTSIWQQNMSLLEHLTLDRDKRDEILPVLKEALGVDELIYLSTCNRVEFIYSSAAEISSDKILHRLVDFFFKSGSDISFFPNDFYQYQRKEAITHLFKLVASLESLVIGENQIITQFKQAYDDAVKTCLVGPSLSKLAEEALVLGRKVRRDTDLVNGSLSMAALACRELRQNLKTDNNATIALVGAGEMTVKMAKYIKDEKLANILFVNRTIEKAEKLAERFNGSAMSLDDFVACPGNVAAIVSATAATMAVFDGAFIDRLPKGDDPIVCVDLAIPRDFSSEIDNNSAVKVIDIPYLKSKSNGNLRRKFVEAGKANSIVHEAVNKFLSDRIEVSLKPIFHDSFKQSLELAHNALDDLFSKRVKSLDKEEQDAVHRLVSKLIGHSAFHPARVISDRLAEADEELHTPLSGKAV